MDVSTGHSEKGMKIRFQRKKYIQYNRPTVSSHWLTLLVCWIDCFHPAVYVWQILLN